MNFLEFKTFRTHLEFYRKKQQGFVRKFFYKVVFLVEEYCKTGFAIL
jgi:hypothetical protein